MRATSLSLRASANAASSAEDVVVLLTITHPELAEPVRLSSHPTQRLSTEPLVYGTISQGDEYLYVLLNAVIPDDQRDEPPRSTLILENVTADMVAPLRSIITPVSVDIRVVVASSPDWTEAEHLGLQGVRCTYDAEQISLDISREPFTSEPWPAGRMTRGRFPGLFR